MQIKRIGLGWTAVILLVSLSMVAMASSLPWESPLNNLQKSLSGPTAKAIALIGLFVAGGLLVFGGELSDFGRRITWMCLAISVMLAGKSFLSIFSTDSASSALVFNEQSIPMPSLGSISSLST
ncbi:MAG: TrbC/VirB2 family protein [Pseudomonadota bacterium]